MRLLCAMPVVGLADAVMVPMRIARPDEGASGVV
jgi:hypothetical protein